MLMHISGNHNCVVVFYCTERASTALSVGTVSTTPMSLGITDKRIEMVFS